MIFKKLYFFLLKKYNFINFIIIKFKKNSWPEYYVSPPPYLKIKKLNFNFLNK